MSYSYSSWKRKILDFLDEETGRISIFVNMHRHLDRVAALISEITVRFKNKVLVVCFSCRPPVYFQGTNINLKLSEDYLTDTDYKYIDEYAISLTRTWYLVKDSRGEGITEYGNIHLGNLVEFSFQSFLLCRIKSLEVMNRVVDLEHPRKVIIIDDKDELTAAARIISRFNNMPLLLLEEKPLSNWWIIFRKRLRAKLSDIFYFSFLDSLVLFFLTRSRLNNLILIDPRAYAMLSGPHQLKDFIFCPVEKGLSGRIYAFKKRKMYISFSVPLSRRLKKQINEQKNELLVKWRRLQKEQSFRDRFRYKDIGIWSLVEGEISRFFKERFPRVLKLIAQINRYHQSKTIRAVVLRADGRETERSIIKAAEKLHIPTLYITHGVLAENNGHDILFCTKTAVWGRADFERYVSLGNHPDKLAITGSPKYDRLYFKNLSASKELVYKKLRLRAGDDFAVLATQPIVKFSSHRTDDENEVLIRSVLSAIRGIPDLKLVIKLHPFEDYLMYKKLLKEIGASGAILIRDVDIFSLIRESAFLITVNSTVGLEAMILEKPVITINLSKREDLLPFAKKGAALGVYRQEDIAPAIERILKDRQLNKQLQIKQKEVVSRYIYQLDGRSSERVVDLINNMKADFEYNVQ